MWKVREEKKEEEISPTAGDVRTSDPRSQGELSTAALQPRPIAKQMVDWLINQRIVTFLEIRIFLQMADEENDVGEYFHGFHL